ncbi:helix-turn-helix domain-containing protein [Micromonospora sp. CPCC 206061]|uniref:helix-turn-helix domain-containing protein n=1 Tax=Micromonospora sp. CPCC 206061 TaxID=3122410 RepID=UPI002FF126BB
MQGGSPALARRRLGHALQELRLQANLTGEEAAAAVERSGSWLSRVESGRIGVRRPDLLVLLDKYGIRDIQQRRRLEALAQESHKRGWWSRYSDALSESHAVFIGLEDVATSIATFENAVIPGLLQTEKYARALFGNLMPTLTLDLVEKRTAVRIGRQRNILGREHPPRLTFILDESVLYRPIGGTEALNEQLERVIEATRRPFIEVRVFPFAAAEHNPLILAFTKMTFEDDPDVVYVETATGGVYEDESQIPTYTQILDHLLNSTLDTQASVAALRAAQERLQ